MRLKNILNYTLVFFIIILVVQCNKDENAENSIITPIDTTTNDFFIRELIDRGFKGLHCTKIIDLDLDGDYDIVGGSEHTPNSTSKGIVWWRNDGGSPISWTKFIIDNSFLHVMSIDVACINETDTFPDIVASSWESGIIAWWQNSGDPTQQWVRNNIVTGWTNAHDAVCHDIDGDGDNDIVGVCSTPGKISVFYNTSGETSLWEEFPITSSLYGAKSISVTDLDNDSSPDIIAASDGTDDIRWWGNTDSIGLSWEMHFVTTNFNGSSNTNLIDMNFDNQLDIIGTGWEGNQIAYWVSDEILTDSWTEYSITTSLGTATNAVGSDIDLDGDIDIIAIGKLPGELCIFYNVNNEFLKRNLDSNLSGAGGLSVFDIDGDGDEDIIAGSEISGYVYLWYNQTIK